MTLESQARPTIYDVALVAGVSHQTVSRVLNRPETVRPANRHRVLAAIASLGYERNAGAEQLGRLHKHRDAADGAD
ncbi:LacI family DNA-binding transcriptional regulator [Curtobacterium phoenicis]|jgi:DNA-binding LacI/PurR family transcriptional regulator|uniref:LacI family DNA-binding transcriptional regulator n=1 Tax=Curtobacterium sp. 1P10AnD TaxID=3132283 RepID=UPI0039A00C4E